MDVIQGLLKEIYDGKLSPVLLDDLITRIEVARNQTSYTAKQEWDEKDVVLITYADQFTNKEKKHFQYSTIFISSIWRIFLILCTFCPFILIHLMTVSRLLIISRSIRWRGTGKISVSSACLHG